MKTTWIRECQECGKEQISPKPNLKDLKERWRDVKCKYCKSEGSLDFGNEEEIEFKDGKMIIIKYEEQEDGTMKRVN